MLSTEVAFLVQSFKETLQYCDEWRKFTSVSQSVSQAVSHSVNFPGGAVIHAYFVVYFKMFAVSIFKILKQYESILRLPRTYMWLFSKPVRLKNKETNCSKRYFPCRIFKVFPPEHPIGPSVEPNTVK